MMLLHNFGRCESERRSEVEVETAIGNEMSLKRTDAGLTSFDVRPFNSSMIKKTCRSPNNNNNNNNNSQSF
jgi:hypothetical protein